MNSSRAGFFIAISIALMGNSAQAATPVQLALGNTHSCALLANQKVKCWGDGSNGQLGYGDRTDRGDQSGEMGNALPFVDLGKNVLVTQIGAGTRHSCALTDSNQVKCWGDATGGVLGLESAEDMGDEPDEIGDNLPYLNFGNGLKPLKIFIGVYHNCALFDKGRIKCWGYNDHGQLGLGDLANRGIVAETMGDNLPWVDLGANVKVVKVSTGYEHTCALLEGGKVKCWGDSSEGQTGSGQTQNLGDQPNEMGDGLKHVNLGTNAIAVDIVTGFDHTCALLNTGAVKCWGRNARGELGLGDTNNRGDGPDEMGDKLQPLELSDLPSTAIYRGGRETSCARLLNNTLKCWGANEFGQLGLGDRDDRGDQAGEIGENLSPVYLGKNMSVENAALGGAHSCAIVSKQGKSLGAKCWGGNGAGQLGYEDAVNRGDKSGDMFNLDFVNLGD